MRTAPVDGARLEPVFRSNFSRLVSECTRRGEEPALAVQRVEDAFCILGRHWRHVVAFDTPTGWLDSRLLTEPVVRDARDEVPVDSDAAWNAMYARLSRDRIWYQIVVAIAVLATIALLLVGFLFESEQFQSGSPPTTTTTTFVRSH